MKASERRRLKHDAYADNVWKALHWIRDHRLEALISVAVLLAVAAAAVWITLGRHRAADEARAALREIENDARRLAGPGSEERRAMVAQLTDRCEAMAMDYPDSDVAASALMRAGQILAAVGEPGAAHYFRRVRDMRSAPAGLRTLAERALPGALESEGRYAEAIEEHQQLLAKTSADAKDQTLWDIARCRELMGEAEAARRDYAALAEGAWNNAWAQLARARMLFLDNPPRASARASQFASYQALRGIPLTIPDALAVGRRTGARAPDRPAPLLPLEPADAPKP